MAEPSQDVGGADRPQGVAHRRDQAVDRPRLGRSEPRLELGEHPLEEPAMMPSKDVVGWPGSG